MVDKELYRNLLSYQGLSAPLLEEEGLNHSQPSDTAYAWYQADVPSALDYYPFGMQMPGRVYVADTISGYRYGFNGMEKDEEVKGSGNSYDFGARVYDSRLGRWWSVDPLSGKYPSMSTFNGMGNNPLLFVDPNGKEIIIYYGNNQSYIVGSKKPVPNDPYVKSVLVAFTAIRAHELSATKLNELISDKTYIVRISEGNIDNFNPKTSGLDNPAFFRIGEVTWNPNQGLVDKANGQVLSPFVALFHELGHAYRYRSDLNQGMPKDFLSRRNNKDNIWRNQEEKENIATNEIPLASFYNQIERENYSQDYEMTNSFNGPIDNGRGSDVFEIPLMPIKQPESSLEMDIIKK